jgi:tol-pal system protein YbgF
MDAQDPGGEPMSARLAPLVLLVPLLAGCASGPFARRGEPPVDPRVERRLLAAEREATKARLEVERLRVRIAELEARLGGAPRAEAPAPAAAAAPRPEPLPPSAAVASIEESELEEPAGATAASPAAPAGAAGASSDDEAAAYERALAPLRDGRAGEAESALQGFVTAFPASELADNAWFWIGEARLMRQDTRGALGAFRTGVERFPAGNKTPDSLFKIGHCLALEGDAAGAAEVWRELARRFPTTAAGERAREALGER